MDRLNYNQLYYFYVVATEGSIKSACEKLHLTQPTISGQLKNLEDDLGHPLFERKYRRLELNSFGRQILKKAEKIFILGSELASTCPVKNGSIRNEVHIGVISSLPDSLVRDFTIGLWEDENVTAHLVHGSIHELTRLLEQGEIDLLLSDSPFGPSEKYKSINIGRQNLVAVGSQKFIDARVGFPRSLNGLPYLSFSKGGQLQEEIDFFFQINNIVPDRIGSVDDDSLIRLVLKKDLCFSILPEQSVAALLANKTLQLIGTLPEIDSNCWVNISTLGSRRVIIRKLINNFLVSKRKNQKASAPAISLDDKQAI